MIESPPASFVKDLEKYKKLVLVTCTFFSHRPYARMLGVVFVVLSLICVQLSSSHAATVKQLELAYLYKFLSFVTLADTTSPEITVVVFSREQFGPDLQSLAQKSVGGKKIVIKPYTSNEDLDSCQVVFVSGLAVNEVPGVLKRARLRQCLTVGDIDDFVDYGGMIGFVSSGGKLSFEINLGAALENGILINSNLLDSASQVIR